MYKYFRSIIESDPAPVVICDLNHMILYMNPAADAENKESGGYSLVGKSILDCHNKRSNEMIVKAVEWFLADQKNNVIHTVSSAKRDIYIYALRDEEGALIGYYEKHEYRVQDTRALYDFR